MGIVDVMGAEEVEGAEKMVARVAWMVVKEVRS